MFLQKDPYSSPVMQDFVKWVLTLSYAFLETNNLKIAIVV